MRETGFLKEKYDLHKSPEVERAAKRTEQRSRLRNASAGQAGEKAPQDPEARIQNYLDRLKNIINPPRLEGSSHFDRRERNLNMLKRALYDKFVIKPEDIPESYFEYQKRLAREQGHGDIEVTDEMKRQLAEVIISDQESTLDQWVDYLSSSDATYPDWLKYWTMRSVLAMGEYDKEKKQFAKRSKGTTNPFPDINREALAYVLDAVSEKYGKQHIDLLALNEDEKKEFETLLEHENFVKLYAWALEKTTIAPTEALTDTRGKWVKYFHNSDHMPLVESLRGHGTGWCTAGESTAEIQLNGGDFHVYYSLDRHGKPTIPRVAIRMEQERIAEIRGIAPDQNLDPHIGDVVQGKLKEFPEGASYEKKTRDMKTLTAIERKVQASEELTKDDLFFLYEINVPIEGFGYQRDPRIAELRSQREPEEDMLVVFECERGQIARDIRDIKPFDYAQGKEGTKAYVGPLVPGIFDKIQEYGIEHIYTEFPEGRIRKETIEIGGKDAKTLIKEMREKKINISDYAMGMLQSKDFTVLEETEEAILVRLKVRDLGIGTQYPTTDDIYKRIEELGLELCPAEVGPNYRLQYQNQPMGEWPWIGMKQITDRGGLLSVFRLVRLEGSLWLYDAWANSTYAWSPDNEFVFRLRKPR